MKVSVFISEIDHSFKQFVLECIDLQETDDDGHLDESAKKGQQMNIPWDDPYPYFVGLIPPEPEADNEEELDRDHKIMDLGSERSPSAEPREGMDTINIT